MLLPVSWAEAAIASDCKLLDSLVPSIEFYCHTWMLTMTIIHDVRLYSIPHQHIGMYRACLWMYIFV
jgi:hypothetical protein